MAKRRYRDMAQMEEAARLYIQEGYTLAQVAAELGVPERTVQEWSRKYDWVRRRKRFLLQNEELAVLINRIALKLARAVLEEGFDPQGIYAMAKALSVLKPSTRERLREIEKLEAEAAGISREEAIQRLREFLSGYGIQPQESS